MLGPWCCFHNCYECNEFAMGIQSLQQLLDVIYFWILFNLILIESHKVLILGYYHNILNEPFLNCLH